MKLSKKIVSGILALSLSLSLSFTGSICTESIFATNDDGYVQGDVDGDGSVDLSDLSYLANFLHGYKATANNNMTQRMDVDLSGIIDWNDIDLISRINFGSVNSAHREYESGNVGIPAQEQTLSYRKHNAQTGAKIGSNYTLNALDLIPNQESRGIIGTDDREINPQKSGVVKLSFYMGDKWHYGSGFIVGNHTILTAAHCLYDPATNSYASNLYYTTYNADESVHAIATAATYHIPQQYVNDPGLYCDYGLITVTEDFSVRGSGYEIYDLGVARDILKNDISSSVYTNINNKLQIFVSGFSGEQLSNSNPNLTGHMVMGSGNLICSWMMWDGELYYDTDLVRGESGGPVYVKTTSGDITVIGINTAGNDGAYNCGKRIDTDILHFVYNNPNI